MSSLPHPNSSSSSSSIRTFVILGVVIVFAILGLLIAYNTGATVEETQERLIAARMNSIVRRSFACTHEVAAMKAGAEIRFEHKKNSLQTNLDALKTENDMYQEQASAIEAKTEECEVELAMERKKKTGVEHGDATDEVLRLQYELKRIEAAIEQANETRMNDRQGILRLIEAYARENDELFEKEKAEELRKECEGEMI